MSITIKPAGDLTVADLEAYPVWQYTNSESSAGETAVRPIKKLPVSTLGGCIVGTKVTLANGNKIWAAIGNVDVRNPDLNEHFVTLSIERNGKWFFLSRYHDISAETYGPKPLASFLGLTIEEVFPITYDISQFCKGDIAALRGKIDREPKERLTRAQLIALAVPKVT